MKSTTIGGLEVRGQGAYVLAPPSEHPGGGAYYFAHRPPAIFTLPTLDALGDLVRLAPAPPPQPARRIPRLARRLLNADPDTLGRYPTRSEAEAAICASLARAGYGLSDVLALFQSCPGPGKFAELHAANPRNAARYLTLTWARALEWTAAHDNDAGRLVHRLRTWALSRPWPGRGGSTARAVYLAHLDIVERAGRDPHHADVRTLGELAGVSWQTAANANLRLVDAALLELVTPSTPSLGHIWRLCAPPGVDGDDSECHTLTLNHPHVMECQSMAVSHDAFRRAGLNKSGCEVLAVLVSASPATAQRIAELTGRGVRTVHRKLAEMWGLGLTEPVGDGLWRAVPGIDLDAIARELGTAGVGERQRRQHAGERRAHRLELGWGPPITSPRMPSPMPYCWRRYGRWG